MKPTALNQKRETARKVKVRVAMVLLASKRRVMGLMVHRLYRSRVMVLLTVGNSSSVT